MQVVKGVELFQDAWVGMVIIHVTFSWFCYKMSFYVYSCMAVWNDSKAFLKLCFDASMQSRSMIYILCSWCRFVRRVPHWCAYAWSSHAYIMCSHMHCYKYIEECERTIRSVPKQTTQTCPTCMVYNCFRYSSLVSPLYISNTRLSDIAITY